MESYMSLVYNVEKSGGLIAALNSLVQVLPKKVGLQLGDIVVNYISSFGSEGAKERVNGRTVGLIFAEFDGREKPETIASGEVDGVRYELTEQPKRKKK